MPVAGGKLILSGSGEQPVSGLGFSPDIVLFFYLSSTVEDVFESLGGCVGFGFSNRSNGVPGSAEELPPGATTDELWSGNTPTSDYRSGLSIYQRVNHGSITGVAMGLRRITTDGFVLDYASGFSGGAGRPIYWLAIGEEPDLEVKRDFLTIAHDSFVTGWQPHTSFSVGSGGGNPTGNGDSGNPYLSAISDIPTWAVSSVVDEFEDAIHGLRSIYMMRAIREASGSNAAFDSINATLPPRTAQLYADEYLTGTGFSFGMFDHGSTLDSYLGTHGYPNVGFIAQDGRLTTCTLSTLFGWGGIITPSDTVGGEIEVDVPMEVEAVIFMCPSFNQSGGIANDIIFASGFGFVTKDFQAIVTLGAHYNVGMARFQSSSAAWVSNFTETAIGGGGSYGTAEITQTGFKLTTVDNAQPARPIMFMALGFPEPGAQFFRRLSWP